MAVFAVAVHALGNEACAHADGEASFLGRRGSRVSGTLPPRESRVPRLNAVTRQRGSLCIRAVDNRLTGRFALPKTLLTGVEMLAPPQAHLSEAISNRPALAAPVQR
jgi:hypothetical protein